MLSANSAILQLHHVQNNLPPAYSGLSIRLPPSYSQACRIIGYHRSQEHISEEHTNVGFENDVSELVLNGYSSDLSNTNGWN
jgi:hypothetical protein